MPYPPCAGVRCIEVEFNRGKNQGFTQGDFMQFSQGILDSSNQPVSLGELCGAKVTLVYSDGYAPTSTLGSGNCGNNPSSLITSSLSQDPTTPPQVVTVSTSVISKDPPCTPVNNGKCVPPSNFRGFGQQSGDRTQGGALCTAGGVLPSNAHNTGRETGVHGSRVA